VTATLTCSDLTWYLSDSSTDRSISIYHTLALTLSHQSPQLALPLTVCTPTHCAPRTNSPGGFQGISPANMGRAQDMRAWLLLNSTALGHLLGHKLMSLKIDPSSGSLGNASELLQYRCLFENGVTYSSSKLDVTRATCDGPTAIGADAGSVSHSHSLSLPCACVFVCVRACVSKRGRGRERQRERASPCSFVFP